MNGWGALAGKAGAGGAARGAEGRCPVPCAVLLFWHVPWQLRVRPRRSNGVAWQASQATALGVGSLQGASGCWCLPC